MIRLTTKWRHTVTALIHLAHLHHEEKTESLSEIARIQGVSLSYLEQLFARLRAAKLVVGTRGPGGGYRLRHAPEDISLARILDALEGRQREERLAALSTPCRDSRNPAQDQWNAFSRDLYFYLENTTLDQFVSSNQPDNEQNYTHAANAFMHAQMQH